MSSAFVGCELILSFIMFIDAIKVARSVETEVITSLQSRARFDIKTFEQTQPEWSITLYFPRAIPETFYSQQRTQSRASNSTYQKSVNSVIL